MYKASVRIKVRCMTRLLSKIIALPVVILALSSSCEPTPLSGENNGLNYIYQFFDIDLESNGKMRQRVYDSWFEGDVGFDFDGCCYYIFEWRDDYQIQLKTDSNSDFERAFTSMASQIVGENMSFDFSLEYQWCSLGWFEEIVSSNPKIVLDSLNRICLCRFVETGDLHIVYQKF